MVLIIKKIFVLGLTSLIKIFKPLFVLFYKHKSPAIVELVDGGICSQMRQYLLAKVFTDKGYSVEFDLSFFKNGTDMNGIHVRNFDLQKAFPYIAIKKVSSVKRIVYKNCFSYTGSFPIDDSDIWTKLTPPRIMLGYYGEPDWLYKDMYKVFKVDPLVLDSDNYNIYNSIPVNSVAVHVRRGDLTEVDEIGLYGAPASVKYFLDSIEYLDKRLNSPFFYFFSDGMDYVESNIISKLSGDIKYRLINNGSAKGYFDLILISKCSHQITSKGSLGKFGACLNPNKGIVVVTKDEQQLGPLSHSNKEILRF